MNNYDRENFNFMMGLSDEEFDEFFAEMPPDDIQYAIELIRLARTEFLMQELELLDAVGSEEFPEAQAVIQRIQSL